VGGPKTENQIVGGVESAGGKKKRVCRHGNVVGVSERRACEEITTRHSGCSRGTNSASVPELERYALGSGSFWGLGENGEGVGGLGSVVQEVVEVLGYGEVRGG